MGIPDITVFNSPEELQMFAADLILGLLAEAGRRSDHYSFVLSGGTTPRKVYENIVKNPLVRDVQWQVVHIFWGDERCVPPDDVQSNFRMAHEALLSGIDIPEENIHRIKGELAPEEGASAYENEMKTCFNNEDMPKFNLVLLGLGDDAHTASLFPDSDAIKEKERWVIPVSPQKGVARITMTIPLLNSAQRIIFIVAGKNKADAVCNVLSSDQRPSRYPARHIHPHDGTLIWLMDREAAMYLNNSQI